MQIKLSQKLNRISAELKFRPKLASWENTLSTAEMFESEFPDWQIDKGVRSNIILFSKENKEHLRVSFNSFAYGAEGSSDSGKFKQFLKTIVKKFTENKIEIYQSLEFRNLTYFESDLKYEELSDLLFDKFYGSTDKIRSISADTVRDVAFTLDGEKNGILNNCRFGPMKKVQVMNTFNSAFEYGGAELDEDKTYLSLDINTYVTEPKIESLKDAKTLLEELEEENKRLAKGYFDLITQVEK
jgi:hypothetical protein